MTIIVALSLISWAIVITVIAAGVIIENQECIMSGVLLLLVVMLAHAFFQVGAAWQCDDVIAQYQLAKKITP